VTAADHPATYQISVSGSLGPALRAAFPTMAASSSSPSTVFRVVLDTDQHAQDLVALLTGRGLVPLSIRRVPVPRPAAHRP
jgi:hypothetical protein